MCSALKYFTVVQFVSESRRFLENGQAIIKRVKLCKISSEYIFNLLKFETFLKLIFLMFYNQLNKLRFHLIWNEIKRKVSVRTGSTHSKSYSLLSFFALWKLNVLTPSDRNALDTTTRMVETKIAKLKMNIVLWCFTFALMISNEYLRYLFN